MEELTTKQRRFCEEYVIDWNATQAAIRAGYSENTAKEIGYENLTKPHIKAYVEEIQKDLSKLAGVSALRNALELKKVAYSNMGDFREGWMDLKDFEELPEELKACLQEISTQEKTSRIGEAEVTTTFIKFKLHDKLKAIEMLNRMFGWNAPDKTDLTSGGQPLKYDFSSLSIEEVGVTCGVNISQ